jgi:hypothetical protein
VRGDGRVRGERWKGERREEMEGEGARREVRAGREVRAMGERKGEGGQERVRIERRRGGREE